MKNVGLTDGACRELPARTDKTCDSGAADRECLVVPTSSPDVLLTTPILGAARCDFFFV